MSRRRCDSYTAGGWLPTATRFSGFTVIDCRGFVWMTNTDQRFVGNQDTSFTIAPFRSWSRSAISIDIPAIGNPRSADGATARRSSGSAPLEMGSIFRDAQQNACLYKYRYRYKRCFANCIRFKNTGGSNGGAGIHRLKRTHAQANPRPCLGPHCAAGSGQNSAQRHNRGHNPCHGRCRRPAASPRSPPRPLPPRPLPLLPLPPCSRPCSRTGWGTADHNFTS